MSVEIVINQSSSGRESVRFRNCKLEITTFDAIRAIESDHDVSRADLARICDVSRRTVDGWFLGRPPGARAMVRLKKSLQRRSKPDA